MVALRLRARLLVVKLLLQLHFAGELCVPLAADFWGAAAIPQYVSSMHILIGQLVRRRLRRWDYATARHAAAVWLLRGAAAALLGALGVRVLLRCLLRWLLVEQMAVALLWCLAAMLQGTAAWLHWSQIAHVLEHRPMLWLPLRLWQARAVQMLLLLHGAPPVQPLLLGRHAGALLAMLPMQGWLPMRPGGGHLCAGRISWQRVHGCLSNAQL